MKAAYLKRLIFRYIIFLLLVTFSFRMFFAQDVFVMGILFLVLALFITYINWRIRRMYSKGFYRKYFEHNLRLAAGSALAFALFTLLFRLEGLAYIKMLILGAGIVMFSFAMVRVVLLKKAK